MKIIKNGKLFGILNLLDIIIILFALAVILPGLNYYIKLNEKGFAEQKLLERYLRKRERAEVIFRNEQKGTIEIAHCSFKNLTKEDLKKIKVGDSETLLDGTILAEILGLGEPEPNYFLIQILPRGGGTRVNPAHFSRHFTPDTGLYSLRATLRLRGFLQNTFFVYKAQALKSLDTVSFKGPDYEVDFVIETWPYQTER